MEKIIATHATSQTPGQLSNDHMIIVFRPRGGGNSVICKTSQGLYEYNPLIEIISAGEEIIDALHCVQARPGQYRRGNYLHTSVFVPAGGLSKICSYGLVPHTRQHETAEGYPNGYHTEHLLSPFFDPQLLLDCWVKEGLRRYNYSKWTSLDARDYTYRM